MKMLKMYIVLGGSSLYTCPPPPELGGSGNCGTVRCAFLNVLLIGTTISCLLKKNYYPPFNSFNKWNTPDGIECTLWTVFTGRHFKRTQFLEYTCTLQLLIQVQTSTATFQLKRCRFDVICEHWIFKLHMSSTGADLTNICAFFVASPHPLMSRI